MVTKSRRSVPPRIPGDLRCGKDLFRHEGAPPLIDPDDAGQAISSTNENRAIEAFVKQFHSEAGPPISHRRESAGWTSSLILHGVLLTVLCLLLAPVDLGDTATAILLRFADETEEPELATMTFVTDQTVPEEDPVPIIMDPPPAVISAVGDKKSGSQQGLASGRSGAAGSAGPRGSFFGVEAKGHDFVYVLDMSGSMEGRRFTRASAELIRSVRGLRQDQMFYVLLFNGSTTQMFGDRRSLPEPIAATEENKQRLSEWLRGAYEGGSTDPRDALRVALRMDPSAVFMLSDGEFDEQKAQKKKTSFVRAGTDTFSIVAASTSATPIHAIAFEDPTSCDNMERLAGMTGGEYRFAEYRPASLNEQSLDPVRDALVHGDNSSAEILMHEIIANRGDGEAPPDVMREFTGMLRDLADQAIRKGDLEHATGNLTGMINVEPDGVATAEHQRGLTNDLLEQFALRGSDDDAAGKLSEIVKRFPNSVPAGMIRRRLLDKALADTLGAIAMNDRAAAMKNLDDLVNHFRGMPEADAAVHLQSQVMNEILAEAKNIRVTKGDVQYGKHLRNIYRQYRSKYVKKRIHEQLRQLALEMVGKRNEASLQGDATEMDRQLREAFGDHSSLVATRQEIARDETRARALLRDGLRLERRSEREAVFKYKELVAKYPATIAAMKANERLAQLESVPSFGEDEREFRALFK